MDDVEKIGVMATVAVLVMVLMVGMALTYAKNVQASSQDNMDDALEGEITIIFEDGSSEVLNPSNQTEP